eukprot:CAMPEP_0181231360 /NCGR_PEP_ID=MMETSP1096-20121128/35058_1 /TAXON_ID=156174 ORGANISM="Chrysochromulina ericina, Strain CCMP281" /NCGR_SAMPLE_ID=MMETSP1096 /ASSEMBLY_ACC=CAM_ASM_000453 /LENGTH=39 /DNA_ID= /DNA_START= /DNA_END= /DNA_ORIENTATION=
MADELRSETAQQRLALISRAVQLLELVTVADHADLSDAR